MPKFGIAVVLIVLAVLFVFRDDIRSDWLGFQGSAYSLRGIR